MQKRRRIVMGIVAVCLAVPHIAGVLWFKQYYDNNYVVDDYCYTIVPLDYDITPQASLDSKGVLRDCEKQYDLLCYNTSGKEKQLAFRAMMHFQELYSPGIYVKVIISKTNVLGQEALDKSDVPPAALARIQEGFESSKAATLSEYAAERTRQLAAIFLEIRLDDGTLIFS